MIFLTVLVGFSVVLLITFILVPFANMFRDEGSKDQTSDVKGMSPRSTLKVPSTPVILPFQVSTLSPWFAPQRQDDTLLVGTVFPWK
jgi:hypothetical protein